MKTATHQYEDKLLELAYGELPAPEASAVQSHVRGCARCTQALSEIQAVRNTMGTLPMQAAPDAGLESLFAYADQAARRNAAGPAREVPWYRRAIAPLAGVCALGLVGVVAWRSQSEGPALREVAMMKAKADESKAAPAPVAAVQAQAPQPELAARAVGEGYKQEMGNAVPAADAPSEEAGSPTRDYAPQQALGGTLRGEPGSKGGLGSELDQAARLSKTRRQELATKDLAQQAETREAAVANKATPKPMAVKSKKAAAIDDFSGAFGVSTGGEDKKELAKADRLDSERQRVAEQPAAAQKLAWGPAVGSPAAAPPAPAAAPAVAAAPRGGAVNEPPAPSARPAPKTVFQPAPAEADDALAAPKGSLGMSLGSSSSAGSGRVASKKVSGKSGDEDGALGFDARARNEKEDPADARKRVVAELEALLSQARAASSARDSQAELRFAQQVLDRGAESTQRVEALKRVCDALELLQRPDEAQPYCDALVREFPSSAAARAVAERHQRLQRSPAPAKRAVQQADEATRPADARPTEAAPKSQPANSY